MNSDDRLVVNTLRSLSIDMIDNAKSGHPGMCLGAAPMLYTLYSRYMCINTNDVNWINRDRFILSSGHASALLYACLFLAGYNGVTLDELKNFRKINSKTPGHPEFGVTSGVDVTTGPLGQGFATAVGIAIGEAHLEERYNKKRKNITEASLELVNYYTYVLCGDGDIMEGVTYEASSLAANLKLGRLIVLYDSNDITLDGPRSNTFNENVLKRYEAMGWHTQLVNDGEDVNQIHKAIEKARMVTDRPSIIEIKTKIGKFSMNEGTNKVHGTPLSKEDITQIKSKMGLKDLPFIVSEDAINIFRTQIYERSNAKYKKWADNYNVYMMSASPLLKAEIECLMTRGLKFDIISMYKDRFPREYKDELRKTNGDIINDIASNMPYLLSGNADVASSTKTYLTKFGDLTATNYGGRNIAYGVREHAMGAISNGLALTGLRPCASCFLSFSDYLKPAIRMSAMMKLPTVYIFTHDSILNGEDGPTHQPVEQLAMLRSIPNLNVFRPADAHEIVGCWEQILKETNKPSALIISKEEIEVIDTTSAYDVSFGAYIVRKENDWLDGIIIATGTEVDKAIKIANRLYDTKNIDIRVVSMPSINLFKQQKEEYKNLILPEGTKIAVLEFLSGFGWGEFVSNSECLMTLDTYGKSGKKDDILKNLKLDYVSLENRIYELFK